MLWATIEYIFSEKTNNWSMKIDSSNNSRYEHLYSGKMWEEIWIFYEADINRDKQWYAIDLFDKYWFNKTWMHKNWTLYDEKWFDEKWFDKEWYGRPRIIIRTDWPRNKKDNWFI